MENISNEPKPVNNSPAIPTPANGPTPTPAPAPSPAQSAATSNPSVGVNGPMPEELKHWSWPAFLLNWIWGIAHNVWIALLMFVPVVNFFMWFYLGMKGNELAWQHRKFESVEQFNKVQKIWTQWAVGLLIAQIVVALLMGSFIFSFLLGSVIGGNYGSSDQNYYQPPGNTSTQDNSYLQD